MSQPRQNGGRKVRAERMAELERENAELREQLGLKEPRTLETWGMVLTQEMRDALAARALISEWGNPLAALRRLGFDIPITQMHAEKKQEAIQLVEQIFKTEGVKLILERNLQDIEANKAAILGRLAQSAMYGDDDTSVRATAQLAKIAGWNKPDPNANQINISLYSMMNGQKNAVAGRIEQTGVDGGVTATDFLSHEPGEPVRIDSGETTITQALEGGK